MSDDQRVVAEAGAALAQQDLVVARAGELGRDVLHVPGRQELALLDIDRPAGFGRGQQQVGLAAQESRDLQHVDCFRHRPALLRRMDVGQDRQPQVSRTSARIGRLGFQADARGALPSEVRLALSKRGLVDQADAELARQLGQRVRWSPARAPGSPDAQGPAIRTNGRSLPMESGPTSTVRLAWRRQS